MTASPAPRLVTRLVQDLKPGDVIRAGKDDYRTVERVGLPGPEHGPRCQASITYVRETVPAGRNLWTGKAPTAKVRVVA